MSNSLNKEVLIAVAAGATSLVLLYSVLKPKQKTSFPHVSSWVPFFGHAFSMVKERDYFAKFYKKNPDGFSFTLVGKTFVMLNDEYSKIYTKEAEGVVSFDEAVHENLLIGETLSDIVLDDPHHIRVLKKKFTPSLKNFVSVVQEESFKGFQKFGLNNPEGVIIDSFQSLSMFIISSTSSHIIFGEDRHRVPEAPEIFVKYHFDTLECTRLAQLFPRWMISTKKVRGHIQKISDLSRPIIEDRLKRMEQPGFISPEDFLQYLIEFESKSSYSVDNLADYVLALVFASMATTAASLFNCLTHLSYYPDVYAKIEEEILRSTSTLVDGHLTKNTTESLKYIEGFIRECLRMCSPSMNSIRKTTDDYTFPDGKFIKKGCYICSENYFHHFNPELYEEPYKFKPERFVENKNKEVSNLWHFGQGIHVCPGRFFAFHELKVAIFTFINQYKIESINPIKEPKYAQSNLEIDLSPIPVKVIKREKPLVELNTSF